MDAYFFTEEILHMDYHVPMTTDGYHDAKTVRGIEWNNDQRILKFIIIQHDGEHVPVSVNIDRMDLRLSAIIVKEGEGIRRFVAIGERNVDILKVISIEIDERIAWEVLKNMVCTG